MEKYKVSFYNKEVLTYDLLRKELGTDYEYSGLDIVYSVWKDTIVEDITNEAEDKFFNAFKKGFCNRPSIRKSKPSMTIADPLVLHLLSARIANLSDKDIQLIGVGHKVAMSAENIIGLILEEYIHNSLLEYGWSICWGNCIKAVDLCSKDGKLIQIKNKSNTENSSSSKIRNNTPIQKWFRFNASNGQTKWENLNNMTTGKNVLSEDSFQQFALNLIEHNQEVINITDSDMNLLKYNL